MIQNNDGEYLLYDRTRTRSLWLSNCVLFINYLTENVIKSKTWEHIKQAFHTWTYNLTYLTTNSLLLSTRPFFSWTIIVFYLTCNLTSKLKVTMIMTAESSIFSAWRYAYRRRGGGMEVASFSQEWGTPRCQFSMGIVVHY